MINQNEFFKRALMLSGSSFLPFSEKDIKLTQTAIEAGSAFPFLEVTKVTEINCPSCNNSIAMPDPSLKFYCSNCGYSEDATKYPQFQLSLNIEKSETKLKDIFLDNLKKQGVNVIQSYSNMYLCQVKENTIAIMLDMGTRSLSDYYKLEGYGRKNAKHLVMIAHSFEPELLNLSIKSKAVSLFGFESFFNDFSELIKKSILDLQQYQLTTQ